MQHTDTYANAHREAPVCILNAGVCVCVSACVRSRVCFCVCVCVYSIRIRTFYGPSVSVSSAHAESRDAYRRFEGMRRMCVMLGCGCCHRRRSHRRRRRRRYCFAAGWRLRILAELALGLCSDWCMERFARSVGSARWVCLESPPCLLSPCLACCPFA